MTTEFKSAAEITLIQYRVMDYKDYRKLYNPTCESKPKDTDGFLIKDSRGVFKWVTKIEFNSKYKIIDSEEPIDKKDLVVITKPPAIDPCITSDMYNHTDNHSPMTITSDMGLPDNANVAFGAKV